MPGVMQKIRALGEQTAINLGYELVQVQLIKENHQWYLRFTIDRRGAITIEDCERFSRAMEPLLDEEDPIEHAYILEVSSAGLDRPLFKVDDYERFIGQKVSMNLYQPLEGRRRFSGRLAGLHCDETGRPLIELELEHGRRITVPFHGIARTRLVPEL